MKSVFLAYRYDEPNKRLARDVRELVESHGLKAATGETLGGDELTAGLKHQIETADALIALLTRRKALKGGGWATHEFAKSELQHARGVNKPAIALVEDGVDVSGLYKENEFISLVGTKPLPAFLRLSRTLALWKESAGRSVKIQLLPEPIAQEIGPKYDQCAGEYRLLSGATETEWRPAKFRREPGGLYLFVHVPEDTMDTMLIEVRIKYGHKAWVSCATPFYVPLPLAEQA